jgi:hypothetical protein
MPLMAPACAAVMSLMPDISTWRRIRKLGPLFGIMRYRHSRTARTRDNTKVIKPEAGTINGAQVESRGVLLPFSPAIFAHFMVSGGLIGLAGTKKTVGPLPGRQGEDLVDTFARHAAGP